jgi:hypothetical protein
MLWVQDLEMVSTTISLMEISMTTLLLVILFELTGVKKRISQIEKELRIPVDERDYLLSKDGFQNHEENPNVKV